MGPSRGGFSRAPRRLGGRHRSKILKGCGFFLASSWLLSDLKYAEPRPPLGELTRLPQTPNRMVRDNPPHVYSPLDAFGLSVSAHTE